MLGGALIAGVGAMSWSLLYPDGMVLSVHSELNGAECALSMDGESWNLRLQKGETLTRLMPLGLPERVEWVCDTDEGRVRGVELASCTKTVSSVLIGVRDFTVMC